MSSFLPIPQCQQQEIDAVQKQLPWSTVGNEPINEYLTPFLATLAFPALFPDAYGRLLIHLFIMTYHLEKE